MMTKVDNANVSDGVLISLPSGEVISEVELPEGARPPALYSPDGSQIVFRSRRDGSSDIFVMAADGSQKRQVTDNGAANFCPFFHPSGKKIIFASNLHDPDGHNFDLYLINIDTRKTERITHYEGFDGFPMFSHDGRRLVFASNRFGKVRGETNVFIADWRQAHPE